jgi:dTDP-4-dehydrorhamnose reductase
MSWPEGTELLSPTRSDVDVTQANSLENCLRDFKPDYVINATAWTDVPGAESNPEGAMLLNAEAVKNMALLCKKFSATLIHISTDYVFDGRGSVPYRETDETNPLNNYGKSKLAGEEAIIGSGLKDFYIIRTSWLYSRFGKNFVKTIARRAMKNEISAIIDDQFGAPTSAGDLASAILSIIKINPDSGIFHYSNSGVTNWFEFGSFVYKLSESDTALVTPRRTEESELQRPAFSRFDLSKWESSGLPTPPEWRESLERELPRILQSIKEEG